MTYLSIIEKLNILFKLLWDFKFLMIFIGVILLFTILYIIKKINSKNYLIFILISFVFMFGISIISNYDVLSNTFDNFATIFFGNIYFPSIYVYIGVLVISFIAFVISIFNIMLKKIYKVINSIMFITNNILFIVILNIIAKNKIDIFSANSLYTNTSLIAVLELSMGLFIVWILSLIVIYITNVICDRLSRNKKTIYNENIVFATDDVSNNYTNIEMDASQIEDITLSTSEDNEDEFSVSNEVIYEKEEILEDVSDVMINTITNEDVNDKVDKIEINDDNNVDTEYIKDDVVIKDVKENVSFNDILYGNIPVTYYDSYTLDEEYNLIDPQKIYEDKYSFLKNDNLVFDNELIELDNVVSNDSKENIISEIKFNDVLKDNVVNDFVKNKSDDENAIYNKELTVEEKTLIEKEKIKEERLIINTISLDDLVDVCDNEVDNEQKTETLIEQSVVEENIDSSKNNYTSEYSVEDYKKIIKMLNDLKIHSNSNNIKIDDAVAISLISNYSIDDCLKFKTILESNLN